MQTDATTMPLDLDELPGDEELTLRPVLDRARLLEIALVIDVGVTALRAATLRWASAQQARPIDEGWARRIDEAASTLSGVSIVGYVSSLAVALLLVAWIRGLYEAAPAIGVGGLRRRPRDAWRLLVPFVGLWVPYAMLADLHAAADPDHVASRLPPPPPTAAPLGAWWAVWMLSGAPAVVAYVLDPRHAASIPRDPTWLLVGFAAAMVANALGVRVVSRLSARVTERARRTAAPRPGIDLR